MLRVWRKTKYTLGAMLHTEIEKESNIAFLFFLLLIWKISEIFNFTHSSLFLTKHSKWSKLTNKRMSSTRYNIWENGNMVYWVEPWVQNKVWISYAVQVHWKFLLHGFTRDRIRYFKYKVVRGHDFILLINEFVQNTTNI